MDFLDKPSASVLLVMLNTAAQLVPVSGFPVNLKSKAAFFARVQKEPVTSANMRHLIVLGDLALKPIEQLAALVDEVKISQKTKFIKLKNYWNLKKC